MVDIALHIMLSFSISVSMEYKYRGIDKVKVAVFCFR